MDDSQLHTIATKSVKGVFALVSRSFLIQILGIVTSFILTIFLDPASFGIFFIVSAIIVFFNYFQDIGLAASLIQKKEEPTVKELRTVFAIQQLLVLMLIVPSLIFSYQISSFYNLNSDGHILLVALLISFLITSLRTIPTVIMERKLDYSKLVIPQILENIFYNTALIVCAVSGLGVVSFTIAVVLRAVVGLVATYIIQPWPIGLSFDIKSVKKLISFGIPFQTNSILALFKDDFLTIFLGKILPIAQVGYIGFAQRLSYLPLRLIMDNVIKITFPSFSRLQDDKKALKIGIEKSLFVISVAIFPVAVGIINFSPFLIEFIPKYQKWEPALLSVVFFSLGTVLSSISTPLTNFLNAIGKVKITLYFMLAWTALTWSLTLFFVSRLGYNGVAIASFLVSLSSIGVFIVSRRYVSFSIIRPTYKQFIAAVIMFGFIFSTKFLITSFIAMLIVGVLSLVVYALVLLLIARKELIKTLLFIVRAIKK
jgi:O-antigen/teichoic acid export membrane protein